MPEETTPGETPTEIPASETPAGTETPTETPAADQPTLESIQADLVAARTALKKVNAESASRRKKLAAFEEAEEKRQAAQLSETEKAQKAAQEWEDKHIALTAKLGTAQMRQAFYEEADEQKLAFVNPQAKRDAFALSDLTAVTMGEDETGMKEAVEALTKSHPHLFGTAAAAANINADDTGEGPGEATEAQLIEFAARLGLAVDTLDPVLVAQAM
jgi:hypothetical protein